MVMVMVTVMVMVIVMMMVIVVVMVMVIVIVMVFHSCYNIVTGMESAPRGAGVGLDHHQLTVAILIHYFEQVRT
jgi:hypothetical protein